MHTQELDKYFFFFFFLRKLEVAKQEGAEGGMREWGQGKPHKRTRHLLQPGKVTLLQASHTM